MGIALSSKTLIGAVALMATIYASSQADPSKYPQFAPQILPPNVTPASNEGIASWDEKRYPMEGTKVP
jgi:hypothetical protein